MLLDANGSLKVSDFGLSALPQQVRVRFGSSLESWIIQTQKVAYYMHAFIILSEVWMALPFAGSLFLFAQHEIGWELLIVGSSAVIWNQHLSLLYCITNSFWHLQRDSIRHTLSHKTSSELCSFSVFLRMMDYFILLVEHQIMLLLRYNKIFCKFKLQFLFAIRHLLQFALLNSRLLTTRATMGQRQICGHAAWFFLSLWLAFCPLKNPISWHCTKRLALPTVNNKRGIFGY